VTEVQELIRDPYAIYARRVLDLSPLDPLHRPPDARLRGSALHRVLEVFVARVWDAVPPAERPAAFRRTVAEVLAAEAPWPATRAAWAARLDRVADWWLQGEAARAAGEAGRFVEVKGTLAVPGTDVVLSGKADRIGVLAGGGATVHDYKTGTPPTQKQQKHFDQQLPLLAAMAEAGAFAPPGVVPVARVGHIGLGATPVVAERALSPGEARAALEGLSRLLAAYADPRQGYLARRAVEREQGAEARDYDHLARFGEWEATEPGAAEDVG
jgi:RecB family exonuclease